MPIHLCFMCSIHINYLGHSLAIIIPKQTLDPNLFLFFYFCLLELYGKRVPFCERGTILQKDLSLVYAEPL